MDFRPPIFRIYQNLVSLFSYRRAVIDSDVFTDEATFIGTITANEYVVIEGIRSVDKDDPRPAAQVKVFLINEGSSFADTMSEFRKLTTWLEQCQEKEPEEHYEVLFVSALPLRSTFKKFIDKFVKEHSMYIEMHTYEKFLIESPKFGRCGIHRIMSNAEVEEHLTITYGQKRGAYPILLTDTQVVWLGARPGMLIHIKSPSENAGLADVYRCVVRT